MTLTFSAPSKTFLSGEYAVLNGNPALVLNTGPRFHFCVPPAVTVRSAGSRSNRPHGS